MKKIVISLPLQQEQIEGLRGGVVDTQPQKVEVPRKFLCPISNEIMKDPVMLSDDGQTYERKNIIDWYNNKNNKETPSGEPIDERPPQVTKNKSLLRKIQTFLKKSNSWTWTI